MNVKELINLLSKEVKKCDRENARITIFCGEQEYEIDNIGGWGLSPDIDIEIKPIESSIMKPATFKTEHKKMVEHKNEEIKKDNK